MPTDFVGPISTFDGIFNQTVAFYMIRYDKQGQLLSPQSLDHLMAHVVKEKITDVLFYSHGWNNDFPTAKARYEAFLTGISDTAKARRFGSAARRSRLKEWSVDLSPTVIEQCP